MTIRKFMTGVWSGKSLGRILQNNRLSSVFQDLHGDVLDLAGDRHSSYVHLLPQKLRLTIANEANTSKPDAHVDFNKPLPFESESFDAVLLLNALYIADDPGAVLQECHRILKPQGRLILSSPFLAHEMPEPHDYVRWTKEGLTRLLYDAKFTSTNIERIGGRCSAAANLLHPILRWNCIRMCIYTLALGVDQLLKKKEQLHPCPILYIAVCTKPTYPATNAA